MLGRAFRCIAAAGLLLATAGPGRAQPAVALEPVVLAYPNVALTFALAYLAEDLGLFAKQGLEVKSVVIAGPGATNAVISGSADFALPSMTTLTRAAAHGQNLLAIASFTDRPVIQVILRNDLVAGFDPKAPLAERVKVLRGRTVAVDAINSIIHGYVLVLAKRGGFSPNDIRISPMAPPSALAAFESKQIDGFAMSMPWPIGPVLAGQATLIASGADGDPADMYPFNTAGMATKPETCEKKRSLCVRMGRGIADAAAFVHDHSVEALALLQKRFASVDPRVLAAGFEQIRKATPRPPVVTKAMMENADLYNIEAGLMKPDEKLKSYDGLFTDAYVR
jgi:NitT/TauT family transport system substrate-binding protein